MDHPFNKLVIYKLPEELSDPSPELLKAENIVFVDENGTNEASQILLKKILQSVSVLDYTQMEIRTGRSIRLTKAVPIDKQNLISFGPSPNQLGISARLKQYQVGKIGQLGLLFVEDLATIGASNSKKKMLWEALKKMFDADTQ